jgi:importin subunit alpha-2
MHPLKSFHIPNREQALYALGNIAIEGPEYRDLILKEGKVCGNVIGVMEITADYLSESNLRNTVKNAAWCISKLCSHKPPPPLEAVIPAIKAIALTMNKQKETSILIDAANTLNCLADSGNDRIALIIKTGIVPRLVELVQDDRLELAHACLKTIGNITYGNEEQTQVVLKAKGLTVIKDVLKKPVKKIRKDACWVLSNIAAGPSSQVEALFAEGLIHFVIVQVASEVLEIKKEALWVIANATNNITQEQIEYLLKQGIVKVLESIIKSPDIELVGITLRVFDNILKKAREDYGEVNVVTSQMEKLGCLQSIEKLQYHDNQLIYKLSSEILRKYFQLEELNEILVPKNTNIINDISIFDF